MRRAAISIALGLLVVGCGHPTAQPVTSLYPRATATPSATPSPTPVPTPTPLASPPNLPKAGWIKVPGGFTAYLYARNLGTTTAMAFGPDGRLYVVTAGGSLVVVPSPGAAAQTLVSGLPTTLGLAWRSDDLFLSVRGSVRAYHLVNGRLSGGDSVVRNLPVGRHQNDWILPMGDGDFLLGGGSTCDVCTEVNPRSAAG